MAEDPNLNMALEAVLRDRDDLYRRLMRAERKLKEMSDLQAMKDSYEARLSEKDRIIEAKDKAIESKDNRIASLERKLEYLERKVWGAMSEKRRLPDDPNQLKLDFGESDMTPEEEEAVRQAIKEVSEYRQVKVREHEKKVPVRQKLPEHLRREEEHIYPEGYLGNEDQWVLFDETETSEHLEYKPAELYVRVTIRHKGMRKDTNRIITAPVKNEPIPKSYASASLLTELMVGKYVDHLPFYRQIQMFKRIGISLPPSSIEAWFHEVADLMRPAYYRLKELVLSSDYVQSDETTIPIINNEKHQTIKGYLWLVRSVTGNQVFFFYHDGSRSMKVALELFKGYQGAIQTDGYTGYGILEKTKGIIIICCWAHARRYFERALKHDKARAEYALTMIGMLYDVERIADDDNMNEQQRMELRKRLAYPIICSFEKWCLTEYGKVLPKSPIGQAMNYFLNHVRQLAHYTMDGKYCIDNNLIENSVRPVAIGRKNYLFCGNHNAAEDAAVIYSFMDCCKAADVDFKGWMNYFLNHVHEYDSDYSRDLAELLPSSLKDRKIL